jgi:TatD DNase family protein
LDFFGSFAVINHFKIMLIDTHCHIYLQEFNEDRKEMLTRAENEGVKLFLMPAIDSATYQFMVDVEQNYPGKSLPMMGLHPCSVKKEFETELAFVETKLSEKKFIAVGEIGLDFYWDKTFTDEQYKVFQKQIELALHYDLPIVIHSRNSTDECIQVVKQNQKGKLKGVFHCFSGNAAQANQITELGFYLGIGGVVTFKNSGLDKVVKEIEMKHIVLETDSPYLAPVPFRGKRNECSYLKYVVEKLSDIKGISKEEIAEITTSNAKRLFSI